MVKYVAQQSFNDPLTQEGESYQKLMLGFLEVCFHGLKLIVDMFYFCQGPASEHGALLF